MRSMATTVPQGGFTLTEVLVAIVVLAIGLLGLAGLQAVGLRGNHSAYLKTQATLAAQDIIERMRANRTPLAGSYEIDSLGAIGAADCVSNPCAPAQMKAFDWWEWKRALARLPGGDGAIHMDGDGVTVTIRWNERGEEGNTAIRVQTEL